VRGRRPLTPARALPGKIHARGPVGVDGLLSTKWKVASVSPQGHIVAPFSDGTQSFVHTALPAGRQGIPEALAPQ
jgi:hypothetical protein